MSLRLTTFQQTDNYKNKNFPYLLYNKRMSPATRRRVPGHIGTMYAEIRQRTRTVRSAPSLFTHWINTYYRISCLTAKAPIRLRGITSRSAPTPVVYGIRLTPSWRGTYPSLYLHYKLILFSSLTKSNFSL